jgi:hypothetical protein
LIVVGAPHGVVQAFLTFDEEGLIKRGKCGPI